jgi:hypothetical protein
LQQLYLSVKVNEECLVLILAENLIQKPKAGAPLLAKKAPLAQTSIHEKAQSQREVGFP